MKKTVFFFAHYDDEFGVYEDIRIHVLKKIPIHIVYVTSSSLSGISDKRRENETLYVLKKLGVKRSQITFIGKKLLIPDLALKDNLKKAYKNCKVFLDKLGNVNTIYSHAYEGGHPDHDALNFICSKLIQNSKSKIYGWQFPLYCGPGLIGPLFYLFKPLKSNGKLKIKNIDFKHIGLFLRLIFSYRSQFKTFIGLYPFYVLHMIFKRNSILQEIRPKKNCKRPHKGKLLYERRNMDQFNSFKMKIDQFQFWLKKYSKKSNTN